MSVGNTIKEARKKAGLTQRELSAKAEIGLASLQRYESDERSPNTATLKKIAAALEISFAHLLEFELVEDFLKTFDDVDSVEDLLKVYGVDTFDEFLINFRAGSLEDLLKKFDDDTPKDALISAFDQLNPQGQEKAVESVELLTKVPEYKK